jgi:hypothetical protein
METIHSSETPQSVTSLKTTLFNSAQVQGFLVLRDENCCPFMRLPGILQVRGLHRILRQFTMPFLASVIMSFEKHKTSLISSAYGCEELLQVHIPLNATIVRAFPASSTFPKAVLLLPGISVSLFSHTDTT